MIFLYSFVIIQLGILKSKELELTLQCHKDGNILSACDVATANVAQVIVPEIKLCVPCYKLKDFAAQLEKVDNALLTFESIEFFQ